MAAVDEGGIERIEPAELWPTSKLERNLRGFLEGRGREEADSQVAIMVTTGAMNPVHVGHVFMFESGKQYLESMGITVVAGYLSPSHDSYVSSKMARLKTRCLSSQQRVACARLSVDSSDWLDVGYWESLGPHHSWPDFPEVMAACQQFYQAFCRERLARPDLLPRTKLYYVCGSDHLINISPGFAHSLLILPRADSKSVPREMLARYGDIHVLPLEKRVGHLSSTMVRKEMDKGVLPPLGLHPAVQAYLAARLPRLIFISASYMVRFYDRLPDYVLESCLLFFGSKRSWLFPATDEERKEQARQPTDYARFPRRFLDYVLFKEQRQQVCFLKPAHSIIGDYQAASAWLSSHCDPVSALPYQPLRLDLTWWTAAIPLKYASSFHQVKANLAQGSHEYEPTRELIYQSNPSLIPLLDYYK